MTPLYKFVVDEKMQGILLPLQDLIYRLNLHNVWRWRLRDITLHGLGQPFGLTFDDFEAATRGDIGYEVTDDAFRQLLKSDFQVLDGLIEAWGKDPARCIVAIDCFDSSQWEVSTDDEDIARRLEKFCRRRA